MPTWLAFFPIVRRLLSVVPPENTALISRNKIPDLSLLRSPSRDSEESIVRIKRRKSTKGWDGEVVDPGVALAPVEMMAGASFRIPGLFCRRIAEHPLS